MLATSYVGMHIQVRNPGIRFQLIWFVRFTVDSLKCSVGRAITKAGRACLEKNLRVQRPFLGGFNISMIISEVTISSGGSLSIDSAHPTLVLSVRNLAIRWCCHWGTGPGNQHHWEAIHSAIENYSSVNIPTSQAHVPWWAHVNTTLFAVAA